MVSRLLLIEDDAAIREAASLVLETSGFEVEAISDAPRPETVPWERYQLVVLDVGLPSANGMDLCREIRTRSSVPVLMLTARDQASDVVAGLDAGADDYVTKPFVAEELAARARAATRRQLPGGGSSRTTVGDLVIDERAFRAFVAGEELDLTPTEMRLLMVLARRTGQVCTRHELLEEVWGYDYLGDSRLVDMAVLRLRTKLRRRREGADAHVATVRGQGYRLDP
jgi:DNA-binding response OmpR family regulator